VKPRHNRPIYRGLKEIARFLNLHLDTVQEYIQADLLAQAVENELEVGIGLIRKRLQTGGLTISRQCANIIREFGQYSVPEKKPNKPFRDKPLEIANYALDALRFMVLGLTYHVNPNLTWI